MTARWFGDHEIVKQLWVGGMATRYLARRHGAAGFSETVQKSGVPSMQFAPITSP